MIKMTEVWNEQLSHELANLKELKKKFQKNSKNLNDLGEYLLMIAALENKSLPEEQQKQFLDFFQNWPEELHIQLYLFLELGKRKNFLNTIDGIFINKSIHVKDGFSKMKEKWLESISKIHTDCILQDAQNEKIFQLIKFTLHILGLWKFAKSKGYHHSYKINIFSFFHNFNDTDFTYYKLFLTEHLNISFQNQDMIPFSSDSIQLKIQKTSKTNYLIPLNQRITYLEKLLKQHQIIEEKKQKAFNDIQKIIDDKEHSFLFLSSQLTKYFEHEEIKNFILTKIINQNETTLEYHRQELKNLKKQFQDEYQNLLIDFGYIIQNKELLEQIKQQISLENLKKILKCLSKKEYTFLTPTHPLWFTIITSTSEETLKAISKEILEKELNPEYLIQFPIILQKSNWIQYQTNKKIVQHHQLKISFFQNSDLLMQPTETLLPVLFLIKEYHCDKLPYYTNNYFDQVDYLIEKRFELPSNTLEIEDKDTNIIKQSMNNPIDVTNLPPEIEWLDTYFKIDSLRYFIDGIIISRLKVIRYLNALNETNDNQQENLMQAIFYNTHLFEFEKEQIKKTIRAKKRY